MKFSNCCLETLLHRSVLNISFTPLLKYMPRTFSEAANFVDNSMYVDNVHDSCETVQSAQQLRSLLAMVSFNLRKLSLKKPASVPGTVH